MKILQLNQQQKNSIITLDKGETHDLLLIYNQDVTYHLHVKQAAHSRLRITCLALGASNTQTTLNVDLCGEKSYCDIRGLVFAKEPQSFHADLNINHQAQHSQSDIAFRNIADEKANIVVAARVLVAEGAQKTFSDMSLRSILLSNHALIDAKPELEIYADDVKCSHGATIGSLDEKALFYLLSRGIEQAQARRLLLQAFMQTLIDDLPEKAQLQVEARLQGLFSHKANDYVG